MEPCPNCRYLATPGEVVEGACPQCHRPYRSQPTPLHSDMEMRNMPAPGEKDTGGNPLQEGILADGGWQNRKVRDESFASVLAAQTDLNYNFIRQRIDDITKTKGPEAAAIWLDKIQRRNQAWDAVQNVFQVPSKPEQGHKLNWQPGGPGRGMFIGDSLHTWPISDEPRSDEYHAAYARSNGGTPSDAASTGFEIGPDGSIITFGNQNPDLKERVKAVEPRLDTGGDEDSFALAHYESNLYEPLFHGESGPGTLYPPLFHEAADFETQDVIAPGGHSFEATPQPGAGGPEGILHNGSLGPLMQMGARINGEPISPENNWNGLFGNRGPVTVSHDDPEGAEIAKHIVEVGSPYGVEDRLQNFTHAEKEAPFFDNLGQALGSTVRHGTLVEGENGYEPYSMALHQQQVEGQPLRFKVPNHLSQEFDQLIQHGDSSALKQALQQRTGGIIGDIGDAASDVGGAALDAGQAVGLVPENLSLGELAGTAAWLIPGGLLARSALTGGKLAAGALRAGGALGTAGKAALSKARSVGGKYLAFQGAQSMLGQQGVGPGAAQQAPAAPYQPQPYQNFTHVQRFAEIRDWHPSSEPNMVPDAHQHADEDSHKAYPDDISGVGGSGEPRKETSGDPQFDKHFPKLFLYALSDDSAEADDDPEFIDFARQLASQDDGADDGGILEELLGLFDQHLDSKAAELDASSPDGDANTIEGEGHGGHVPGDAPKGDSWPKGASLPTCVNCGFNFADDPYHIDWDRCPKCGAQQPVTATVQNLPSAATGNIPNAPQTPAAPQAPSAIPNVQNCPRCGAPLSPEATSCPQCGSGTGTAQQGPGAPGVPTIQPVAQQTAMPSPEAQPGREIPRSDQSSAPCANCGAIINGGTAICPQCHQPTAPSASPAAVPQVPVSPGAQLVGPMAQPGGQPAQYVGKTGANHMGPHNNEQFAAVAEYLTEQGREAEIPDMLAEPWLYAEELAAVQNKLTKPPTDDTLSDTPPQPAQEEAPPEATMPVPGMSGPGPQQPMAAVNEKIYSALEKYASPDAHTPRCPNCGSGSTGLATEEGDCHCHACGKDFKREVAKDFTSSFTYVADHEHHEEGDSSLTWTDASGYPLHVGSQYELHIPGVSIPDFVTISAVKPDALEYELTGEYGVSHTAEITREEKDMMDYKFSPVDDVSDEAYADEPSTMDSHQEIAPGEVSDLSVPHMHTGADGIKLDKCPNCGGTGKDPDAPVGKCYYCKGKGTTTSSKQSDFQDTDMYGMNERQEPIDHPELPLVRDVAPEPYQDPETTRPCRLCGGDHLPAFHNGEALPGTQVGDILDHKQRRGAQPFDSLESPLDTPDANVNDWAHNFNPETGEDTRTCPQCGESEPYYGPGIMDPQACPNCGFVSEKDKARYEAERARSQGVADYLEGERQRSDPRQDPYLPEGVTNYDIDRRASLVKEAPGGQHQKAWGESGSKRNRQYEHIKEQLLESGKSEEEAKEEAARTVNKTRAEKGETKKGAGPYPDERGDTSWTGDPLEEERAPQIHTFDSTGEAYDASQTRDDIKHGDILHVPNEGVTGYLDRAWPVAVTPEHGAFHVVSDPAHPEVDQEAHQRALEYANQGDIPWSGQPELTPSQVDDGPNSVNNQLEDEFGGTYGSAPRSGPQYPGPLDRALTEPYADVCSACAGNGNVAGARCEFCGGTGLEGGGNDGYERDINIDNDRPHLAYLLEGGGMETVADQRTAGAKFDQQAQRKFIDEDGTARNKDKLNLAGTHYEMEPLEDLFGDSFL